MRMRLRFPVTHSEIDEQCFSGGPDAFKSMKSFCFAKSQPGCVKVEPSDPLEGGCVVVIKRRKLEMVGCSMVCASFSKKKW